MIDPGRAPKIDPSRRPPQPSKRRVPWWGCAIALVVLLFVAAIAIPGLLSTGCIIGGTMVDTPSGPRAIETLRPGDAVLTRSGEGRIERVLSAQSLSYQTLRFSDGSFLRATQEHPIATADGWVEVKRLLPGTAVQSREGWRTLASIESSHSFVRVYDLEIEPDPTFFASGVVVHNKSSPERSAAWTLRSLSLAEADFRANDRDNNKINDFWVGDVAGLYALPVNGDPLKLIELSVAAADADPKVDLSKYSALAPKFRYRYAVIPLDEDGKPYDDGSHRNPSGFAFCAFPAQSGKNQATLIVNENNTIYRKRFETPERIHKFPSEEELKTQGWSKVD